VNKRDAGNRGKKGRKTEKKAKEKTGRLTIPNECRFAEAMLSCRGNPV